MTGHESLLSPKHGASGSAHLIDHPRTGTAWTSVAHIITAVIGAGVLSLSWSMAQLGYVAGVLTMLLFAALTYLSAHMISDCYRSADPEAGDRNRTYLDAVGNILGARQAWLCGVLRVFSLFKTGVAYTIVTAVSIRAISQSNCYHREGRDAECAFSERPSMILFGVAQAALSLIPSLGDATWLSVVATATSFSYASIGVGLAVAQVVANGGFKGSLWGVGVPSASLKVWRVSQAIGDIAFAFPFTNVLLEIQDLVKAPPAENVTTKRASRVAVMITSFFYLSCGIFGYAAFGNDTPGNLLTGFGFYEPFWLIDFANVCIIIHITGAYQVFGQLVFVLVDGWLAGTDICSGFMGKSCSIKLPLLPSFSIVPIRLCYRTAYVFATTAVALIFPYFNQMIGLAGAFSFWPLVIYYPVEMYLQQKGFRRWSKGWVALRTFSGACLLVSAFAFVGSLEGLLTEKAA